MTEPEHPLGDDFIRGRYARGLGRLEEPPTQTPVQGEERQNDVATLKQALAEGATRPDRATQDPSFVAVLERIAVALEQLGSEVRGFRADQAALHLAATSYDNPFEKP